MTYSFHHIAALLVAPFIGSFLSVLVVRLPAGEGVVLGRSRCPACGHALGPSDLVPLLSWLWRRGLCRHCGKRISASYPAIELAAVAVVLWAAFVLDGWLYWATCLLGWALLALAAADLRTMLLPDALTLPLLVAGLAVAAALGGDRLPAHLAGAVVGFAVLCAVGILYRWLRGRDGIGLGDAKLLGAAGAWVGWLGLPSVLLVAGATALVAVIVARLAGRPVGAADPVPFGAFLAFGSWWVWLYGPVAV